MNKNTLCENEKFIKLEELCSQAGFIHAFSYLCQRDCTIGFQGEFQGGDLHHLYTPERLIKTELSTLHGLLLKSGYDNSIIDSDRLKYLADRSEILLGEIHESMQARMMGQFTPQNMKKNESDFFSSPDFIREYIFYSAEQAFEFQFAGFSVERYEKDAQWLLDNVGFDMKEAHIIYLAITKILNGALQALIDKGEEKLEVKSYLERNEIPIDVLSQITNFTEEKIASFLSAFSTNSESDNTCFSSVDNFNLSNPKPIIQIDDKYYLFQVVALAQSLYESPIFWLRNDKAYIQKAVLNRGAYTEEFAYKKFESVFGKGNVFTNIDIYQSVSKKVGEIDVLARFGNKYLIIQAKSKGMTIPAKKGQVELVKDDFIKGFQNAYQQALECAEALMLDDVILKDINGEVLDLGDKPTVCYPICLTSESYPALSFQCRQYLQYEETKGLLPPLVIDVFFLDVLVEFLSQPLLLLSYIDRRGSYLKPMMASTELVFLSMHLKKNLWLDENKNDFMMMHDDIASDLDASFMVRRLRLPGNPTPEGILQRYSKGFISKVLFKVQLLKNDRFTDFGFELLKANGDFLDMLDSAVAKISYSTIQDGRNHDFSVLFDGSKTGFTIHTEAGDLDEQKARLSSHMEVRKYIDRADNWIGIIIDPVNGMITAMCHINYPWEYNEKAGSLVKKSKKQGDLAGLKSKLKFKIGRNDRCPCGSGKKFKKCCID